MFSPRLPFPREAFFIPFPCTKPPSLVLGKGGVAKAKGGASLLTELDAAFEL